MLELEELLKAHRAFATPMFEESLAAEPYRKEPKAIGIACDDYFLRDPAERPAEVARYAGASP